MTPEQRLDRAECMLLMMVKAGRRARSEWREKVNILIDAQIRNEAAWRAKSDAINQQIKKLVAAQAKTDQALRAFINSMRKGRNGKSSN